MGPEPMTSAIPVQCSTTELSSRLDIFSPTEFFSGLFFTPALVVFITAKIASIFTSLSAVQIYDFHIFTAVYSPLHGFIWNQHSDQLPVGLLVQLVEHCTGIAGVMGSGSVQLLK